LQFSVEGFCGEVIFGLERENDCLVSLLINDQTLRIRTVIDINFYKLSHPTGL
jgi:hypothetical protein